MKRGHEPYRTCVGCRQRKPKRELLRLVYDAKAGITIDPLQKQPGRGAYLCKALDCAQKAIKRKNIGYALRRSLTIPPEFLKVFEEY